MTTKKLIKTLSSCIAACLVAAPVWADYPTKPVTIVSPYGAGGNADLAARSLAVVADKHLGEKVLVVNKTGAGGVTGSAFVLDAKKDGYTLLLARVGSQAVRPAMDPLVPYEWDDFGIIGMLETNPYVCVVAKASPIEDFDGLVATVKERPGTVTYGSTSVMDASVVFPVTIFQNLGLDADAAIKIPYQGGGAQVAAVLGQQVDFACNGAGAFASGLKSGDLRALVVSSKERIPEASYAPTAAEVDMPNLELVSGWSALYGPSDLPDTVMATWTDVLSKVSQDQKWIDMVKNRGSVPSVMSPEETREFVAGQFTTFRTLAEDLGVFSN